MFQIGNRDGNFNDSGKGFTTGVTGLHRVNLWIEDDGRDESRSFASLRMTNLAGGAADSVSFVVLCFARLLFKKMRTN